MALLRPQEVMGGCSLSALEGAVNKHMLNCVLSNNTVVIQIDALVNDVGFISKTMKILFTQSALAEGWKVEWQEPIARPCVLILTPVPAVVEEG